MCGIVLVAAWHASSARDCSCVQDDASIELVDRLRAANAARGPDAQRRYLTALKNSVGGTVHFDFFASELRLRGNTPVTQPHINESGDVLCWNGEIFEGLDVHPEENDGTKLFAAMSELNDASDIVRLLGTLEGPYAFVYYHHRSRHLFFARDPLGRRSLLVHWPDSQLPRLLLASVSVGTSDGYDLTELSTEHIYALDLDGLSGTPTMSLDTYLKYLPRLDDSNFACVPFTRPERVNRELPPVDTELPRLQSLDSIPVHLSSAVEDLICHLDRSVALRVRNIPRRTVKSSPIDNARSAPPVSARVAVLFSGGIDSTTCAYLADRHIPPDEPIDLLNIAFENPRKIRVQVDGNVGGMNKKKKKLNAVHDVASMQGQTSGRYDPDYLVPDRSAGLSELEELRKLCPNRQWNFVEIDVPYTEYRDAQPTVKSIMWPCQTVMDLSLAMALYFAARGVGKLRSSPDAQPEPYASPARVLLNGLGSDELLGGYGRHRTAFGSGGWKTVIDELQLEIDRIPTRNLGRDDRVISAHGKETRHPFLSLDVVNFLVGLPVHFKLDPRLEVGVGDKMLLRLAARKLGLVEASARKKRAMQFGTHSARMEAGAADGGGTLPVQ